MTWEEQLALIEAEAEAKIQASLPRPMTALEAAIRDLKVAHAHACSNPDLFNEAVPAQYRSQYTDEAYFSFGVRMALGNATAAFNIPPGDGGPPLVFEVTVETMIYCATCNGAWFDIQTGKPAPNNSAGYVDERGNWVPYSAPRTWVPAGASQFLTSREKQLLRANFGGRRVGAQEWQAQLTAMGKVAVAAGTPVIGIGPGIPGGKTK